MEKLSARKRSAIVRDYLSGLPYREIAARQHVSIGAVTGVVADLKEGRFPEAGDIGEHIEQIKELSIDLKKAKLTPDQCALGLMVMARIKECGLEPSDIDRWPLILKSVANEDEAQQFIKIVYSINEVSKRTGLSLDVLDDKVHELEKKVAELEPMSIKLDDGKKEVAKLTRQRKQLSNDVASLEQKGKFLNPELKELEKRKKELLSQLADMEPRAKRAEVTLATLSKETQRLHDIGFSFDELTSFNQKLQAIAKRHSIKRDELRSRLLHELETVDKGLGLEKLIENRQHELELIVQDITRMKKEAETVRTAVTTLKQEKTNLETSIKESSEKASREIAKIIPLAKDTIDRLANELQISNEDTLAKIGQLGEKALEVGKEIGRYEEMLQSNQWLGDLLSLVRGEESLESIKVRTMVLLVLRGTLAWLKHNETGETRFFIMQNTFDSLIKEVEQWKT